jgi:hypothetical protein
MTRITRGLIGALVATATLSAGTVNAQPPRPGGFGPPPPPGGAYYSRPPAFSPYLNLLRGGNAAINYYGLVRPELQFRQALQNLSGDVAMNQQMIGNLSNQFMGVSGTGHPTQFMNLGGYFMNSGGGGMGASILGPGNPGYGGSINLTGPAAQGAMGAAPLRR